VQKPDISKRPSVIGTTKSPEPTSPTLPGKPKNRKPSSKASDIFPEPLSSIDGSNFLASQHLMKSQKITSPLNTPSIRDQMSSGYSSVVSTHFPFQHPISKPDPPTVGQGVSNGVPNPALPKSSATVTHAQSSKENRKSPPTLTAAKKSEKTEESASSTKSMPTSSETKSTAKSNTSIAKKRKNNKSSSADEDGGKKKQKTNSNHEKKTSYSLGAVGKGKIPILPPSPFVCKSSSTSSIREM
jgi:hypothetical protein